MIIRVLEDKASLGKAAAEQAATAIRSAISDHGQARIAAASGASQFEFLDALSAFSDIDWKHVALFHLDEYIGLPMNHPASFCTFLRERLVDKNGIVDYHSMDGQEDPLEVIRRTTKAVIAAPIDIAFVGIGENAHLAFNDPPADFETEEPFLIVNLDHACRNQQVREGWFPDISAVPSQAISMSVRQVLRAREILAVVPDSRKAQAVKSCFDGPISPSAPASILRTHPNTTVYLDKLSAALLSPATLNALSASA